MKNESKQYRRTIQNEEEREFVDSIRIGRIKKKALVGAKVRLNKQESEQLDLMRLGVVNKSNEHGVSMENVPYMWVKSKGSSLFVKNPEYTESISVVDFEEIIDNVIKKHNSKKQHKRHEIKNRDIAVKVTTTDDHVGMNPNPDNQSIFSYEYNGDIYRESMNKVYNSIMSKHSIYGDFDLLLIDNLGDMADGWNGRTTRGGHDLPQNMSNPEVFETCVDSKVELISKVVESNITNKIILRCVSNDNHAGSFGEIINIAIQKIINLMYGDIVQVDILRGFLEQRVYGDHCFILTHGKDKEHTLKGLPLHLNAQTIKFINDYIDHHNITSKYIHVEKGDLHQLGYDKTQRFDYRNYMTFAPPSSHIQYNYSDGYSGYSIQVVPKYSNEIDHTNYFIDYKTKTT